MFEAMRAYKEVGFDGVIIPDHAPRVAGDSDYRRQGVTFALGYMRSADAEWLRNCHNGQPITPIWHYLYQETCMEKIRIALIGGGGMANGVHYPSLAAFDDVKLVGLCDLVPSKLQATAERFQIEKTFTDYKQMLEATSPDAVYVLMPPQHLFAPVIHCLSQGHHVFIEKPPGVTLHQTQEMALAAEEHNCKTMVGFNRRFIPLMRQVKGIVEEKGPIIQCMSHIPQKTPQAHYTMTVSLTC